MIVLTARIEVRPAARREMAQALLSWVAAARATRDAQAHLYEDLEAPEVFCLTSVWPTGEALETHVTAGAFGSLVGAVELLASPVEVHISELQECHEGLHELRRRHGQRLD